MLLGPKVRFIPYSADNARLSPLSNRRYTQLNVISDLGIMISKSGKYSVVSIHDLATSQLTSLKKKSKFETETKFRKMKETTGCYSYRISICNFDFSEDWSCFIPLCFDATFNNGHEMGTTSIQ